MYVYVKVCSCPFAFQSLRGRVDCIVISFPLQFPSMTPTHQATDTLARPLSTHFSDNAGCEVDYLTALSTALRFSCSPLYSPVLSLGFLIHTIYGVARWLCQVGKPTPAATFILCQTAKQKQQSK